MIARQAIVTEARSWIGTRFRTNTCLKGVAVDCINLVAGVAVNVGSLPMHPYLTAAGVKYKHQPRDMFVQGLQEFMVPVQGGEFQLGDVLLTTWAGQLHTVIVGNYLHGGHSIIHAFAPAKQVCESRMSPEWLRAINAVFAFPGVEA